MLAVLVAVIAAGLLLIACCVVPIVWYLRASAGLAYFGLSTPEKEEFARKVYLRGLPVRTVMGVVGRLYRPRPLVGGSIDGIDGPLNCPQPAFQRGFAFEAGPGDVVVATQMKCGTTWMKQVVFEIASRGRGDLTDTGYRHIYGAVAWIEADYGVPIEQAPRIGPERIRVIKTHMPIELTKIGPQARYIYVARHPVACFASMQEFMRGLAGPLVLQTDDLVDWFCTDKMWWTPWPRHVDGWWKAAAKHDNVLFVHFEDMLADLPGVIDRVAAHIGVALTPEERDAVVVKCGYDYMKQHEDRFTMAPPSLFTADMNYMPAGRTSKSAGISDAHRKQIGEFCKRRMADSPYPLAERYPDL